ncbi:kinesin-like protein KIF20A [Ambystoma mexicanum]|uniref:kinesin-like protein KIF20A n=1 Tax=Ambystoma mexicanum TaxID=8296 RepID=UPI0037E89DFB
MEEGARSRRDQIHSLLMSTPQAGVVREAPMEQEESVGSPASECFEDDGKIALLVCSEPSLQQNEQISQPLKVYLRVRPFSKAEIANNESQDCINIENSILVALQAPKESNAMKNSEKGIGQSVHKFTFTKIFGPDTSQEEFFEGTVKDLVNCFIEGKNGLVFTYGVTNAGKTFTIQGTPKDGGILPRSLDVLFNRIRGKHYLKMDFKPFLSNHVMKLVDAQVKQEEVLKASVFATLKEEAGRILRSAVQNMSSTKSPTLSRSPSNELDTTEHLITSNDTWISMHRFSVWVSFCEIYNEYVYDLLDLFTSTKQQKRPVLKVCDDQAGSSYLKDIKWFNITSTDEACKILKIGNKNRSLASTRMNQQSSRSHSIFSIRLLRLSDDDKPSVLGVSEMSLCDLAGSERCTKTESFGDRLKEAGNINNSLLILGKCIAALKQNQNLKMKQNYIPFRESKLTRLFQPFFCGKGKACMIVNINQCASNYDETLHVMKFSAVAKEVVQTINPRVLDLLTPKLVGRDGRPIKLDVNTSIEDLLSGEDFLEDEEELDVTALSQEDALMKIANLREKLLEERQSKFALEMQIRKEMGEEMLQQLLDLEETWSKRCDGLKETYEEQFEDRFEMYKKAIQKHSYNCAMEEIEDSHVPKEELQAEKEKLKEREKRILELEMALNQHKQTCETNISMAENATGSPLFSGLPQLTFFSCPTTTMDAQRNDSFTVSTVLAADLRNKEMCSALEDVKKQCEGKEELITYLRRRIQKIEEEMEQEVQKLKEENESLKAEIHSMKQLLDLKEQEMEGLKNCRKRVLELETTVLDLQEEQQANILPKQKKGLFSNLKATVTGSPKSGSGKTKEKSFDETLPSSKKRTLSSRKLKE